MSHRDLDDLVDLRRRIAALDVNIKTAMRDAVVDLMHIAEMKLRREEMAAHLACLVEIGCE